MSLFLLVGISFNVNSGSLKIVGNPGAELSAHDVEDIKRLTVPEGDKPWLFIGVGGQLGTSQIVRVFCSPTKRSNTIRRGPLVHIGRRRSNTEDDVWLPWSLFGSEFFAQVRIQGREFDDVKDNKDSNRPFSVVGDFSDQELEQIVKLVRTSPSWTPPIDRRIENKDPVQVKGKLPIWWIHRKKDDSVEVNLLDGPSRGQIVYLKMEEGEWIITGVGMWIA